jgi:predicted DNA-binding ribbon-helix-helix protein
MSGEYIWRKFFDTLKLIAGKKRTYFHDLIDRMYDLAEYEMNGRQIHDSITTRRQLAKYKK